MPTPFESMLVADAVNVFAGAADFGEPITYKDKLGVQRTYFAQVFREPPAAVIDSNAPGQKAKPAPLLSAFIPHDPAGVKGQPARPDRGGLEAIFVAEVNGGTATWFPITDILSADPGGWTVKLR